MNVEVSPIVETLTAHEFVPWHGDRDTITAPHCSCGALWSDGPESDELDWHRAHLARALLSSHDLIAMNDAERTSPTNEERWQAEKEEIYAAHAQLIANQRAYHEAEVSRLRDENKRLRDELERAYAFGTDSGL